MHGVSRMVGFGQAGERMMFRPSGRYQEPWQIMNQLKVIVRSSSWMNGTLVSCYCRLSNGTHDIGSIVIRGSATSELLSTLHSCSPQISVIDCSQHGVKTSNAEGETSQLRLAGT